MFSSSLTNLANGVVSLDDQSFFFFKDFIRMIYPVLESRVMNVRHARQKKLTCTEK